MHDSLTQLDDSARQVLRNATKNANDLGHIQLQSCHILLGILDEGSGVTASFLRAIDRDFSLVRAELENRMPSRTVVDSIVSLPRSRSATQVLEHAYFEMTQSGDWLSTPAHLILGILRVPGTAAHATLVQLGVRIEDVRMDIANESCKNSSQENAG